MAIQKLAPTQHEIGGLEVIDFSAPAQAPVIILFHGYGANDADLAPLVVEMKMDKPARWIFPNGIIKLDSQGFARAWYDLNMEAFERAQSTGQPLDFSQEEPAGLKQARDRARDFIRALNIPWSQMILGGFSQGAILATDLVLHAPDPARGLIILSGNLISEKTWSNLAAQRKGLAFFQSHGIADPILGFRGAQRLESLLKKAGLSGQLLSFEGGHAIPSEVVSALRVFLSDLL